MVAKSLITLTPGRSVEQLHRQELPDPALRPAQALRLHRSRAADDHCRRKNVLRKQRR